MLTLLAALACGITPDIDRLADPEFSVREGAEQRLRVWGLLAAPQLNDLARTCEDAEARSRANRLLRPWRQFERDYYAARLLLDPWATIGLTELFEDEDLRWRIARIATAHGCHGIRCFGWDGVLESVLPLDLEMPEARPEWVHDSLMDCRRQLGVVSPGWPFTK